MHFVAQIALPTHVSPSRSRILARVERCGEVPRRETVEMSRGCGVCGWPPWNLLAVFHHSATVAAEQAVQ